MEIAINTAYTQVTIRQTNDELRTSKMRSLPDGIFEETIIPTSLTLRGPRPYEIYGVFTPPSITKVIFNNPATIVYWSDRSRTVVKCEDDDLFDPEKGLAMAISKKFFDNTGRYYEEFKKWLPKESENLVISVTPKKFCDILAENAKKILRKDDET